MDDTPDTRGTRGPRRAREPGDPRPQVAFVIPPYRVGSEMAGIGVRVWEFAQVFSRRCRVTILAKETSDLETSGVRVLPARDHWREVLGTCDAAVFYDMPDTRMLLAARRAGALVISDNAVPIEHLEYHGVRHAGSPESAYGDLVARFALQVLLTDHFILRSRVARSTLIAALSLVGRLSYVHYDRSAGLDHLFSWVPIGFNSESDAHAKASPERLPRVDFVWTGGLWDYYDPGCALSAVRTLEQAGTPVSLRFMYMPPPDQVLKEAERIRSAVRGFGIEHRVEFLHAPLPHRERDGVVKSALASLCLARDGIENHTCIRLRLRDAFLYRQPILTDSHGATGDLVRGLGIGIAVDTRDASEVAAALHRLASDPELRRRLVDNIERVRGDFCIDAHTDRVIDFIGRKRHAPDLGSPSHDRLVRELLERHPELEEEPVYPF